jgi:putative transposase
MPCLYNFWDHIIRNENEYKRIAQYIIDNPTKWENDKLNGRNENIVMEPSAEYNSEIWMI